MFHAACELVRRCGMKRKGRRLRPELSPMLCAGHRGACMERRRGAGSACAEANPVTPTIERTAEREFRCFFVSVPSVRENCFPPSSQPQNPCFARVRSFCRLSGFLLAGCGDSLYFPDCCDGICAPYAVYVFYHCSDIFLLSMICCRSTCFLHVRFFVQAGRVAGPERPPVVLRRGAKRQKT